MNMKELVTFVKSKKRLLIPVACVLVILIVILCLFCCRTGRPVREVPQIQGNNETELPDLAEAINHLSQLGSADFLALQADADREAFVEDFWRWSFGEAGLPQRLARKVSESVLESPSFVMELLVILQQDPYTYYLVDKQHMLPEGYEPGDLLPLKNGTYHVTRNDLSLRKIAYDSLQEMAEAAAAEGVVFTIGSSYRSAAYQKEVYERNVKTYGKETADRESAQPRKSQHQLGLIIDFSPIDDSFAETEACKWMLKNASRFGWSISFPDGYEEVTGYRWESWHYRYVGRDLAAFIDNYFEGVQQYALQFIHAWQAQEQALEQGVE